MQLHAFEVVQNRKKFYVTYLSARQLMDEARIRPDIYSSSNTTGYQRELSSHRANSFAKFISNQNNFSPGVVLLSVRDPVRFTKTQGGFGVLDIPDTAVMWVVDGQHRIAGVRRAMSKGQEMNISMPAIVVSPMELEEADPSYFEAKEFVVINRTQKRVRADVSDRFIARLTPEQRRELEVLGAEEELARKQKAVLIADNLNSRTSSVWHNRIRIPGSSVRGGVVSQVSFTSSIMDVVRDAIFEEMSDDEIADILDEYWRAWQETCPLAFDDPESYLIQKTTGVYTLHLFLREVARVLKNRNIPLTKDNFYSLLSKMTEGVDDDFWSRGGEVGKLGSGKKVYDNLSRRLYRSLLEGLEGST